VDIGRSHFQGDARIHATALLTIPLAIKASRSAFQSEDMSKLMPGMATNVSVVLFTQLLTAVGYILSGVFKF